MDTDIAQLKKEVSLLRKELSRVSDEAEVRKVHFKYGYYLDKCLYNEVCIFSRLISINRSLTVSR